MTRKELKAIYDDAVAEHITVAINDYVILDCRGTRPKVSNIMWGGSPLPLWDFENFIEEISSWMTVTDD